MKVYKITDKDDFTRRGQDSKTKWGKNVRHQITKRGNALCSDKVFHCYKDPYLAILMNPSHGNYKRLQLWEAETPKIVADDGTKSGCKTLTTIKKITTPTLTTDQLVEIAIRCAMKVYDDKKFQDWAMKWITGLDRSVDAAYVAYTAAHVAYTTAYVADTAADFDLIAIIHEVVDR